MKFLRLSDPLLSVLFENEDILAIDKPYGFNTHTNDSKADHSDFIQDGLIEMLEKQFHQKLHIIHRLDQTTTGVVIFGKSQEAAKKYADFFFNREVKKTYWFVTGSQSLKTADRIDQAILQKGKELHASTEFELLKKSKKFELWKANPLTGRNHQIRIHSRQAGISVLGDLKYDGQKYPFLCLHNHQIEFPNQILIKSKPPVYFENLDLLEDLVLVKALFEVDRRNRLYSFSGVADQCFRMVHAKNNFKEPGFTVDHFGQRLVLTWYKESWTETDAKRFSIFSKLTNRPLIVRFPKSQLIIDPVNGMNVSPSWRAREKAIQYELRSDSGEGAGLLLSQRLHRNWLLKNSKGRSVLNLFSYTGGLGLAAALGQAQQVTCVEANKNYLAWGKRNFELNGLDTEKQMDKFKFLCRDSLVYLKQCRSKNLKFNLIVCDAPSFFRGEKGVFKIELDLKVLLKSCFELLSEGGELLFLSNFEGFFIDDFRKAFLQVQKELNLEFAEFGCIEAGLDFELPGEKASLKSFLIRLPFSSDFERSKNSKSSDF
jgi:23S rRNA (cytosine1962-C5)-methyltransferase